MRSLCSLTLAVALGSSLGCGSGETKLPGPLTDEMKKAIKEDDERVYNEEGGKPQQQKKKGGKK